VVRDRIFTALKVAISLALIAYLFTRVNLAEVGETLASAKLGYIALALILYLVAIALNSIRWHVLLRAQGTPVPLGALLQYTFVGVFFNNFLPANVGGDVMRGYGLAKYTDQGAEAAVSVVVDRVVGLIAFMISAVIAALIAIQTTGQQNLREFAVAAAITLGVVGLGFLLLLSRSVRSLLERIFQNRLLARLAPLVQRFSHALDAYRNASRALLLALAISLITVFVTNLVNWLLAVSLGGGISLLHISLFNPLIAFVLMIPISIGGLGLNQSAYVFFFSLVDVPERLTLAISLVMQVLIYISSLPGGILWWRGRRKQVTVRQS
jgi:uncharacterized protein (TIRG00374 family)